MSMHTWSERIYGVELPREYPEASRIAAFVENHADVFGEEAVESVSTSDDEAIRFVQEYDNGDGWGISAVIADAIQMRYVIGTTGDSGNEYVGIFSWNIFPWSCLPSDEFLKISREDMVDNITESFAELYGYEPRFGEYDVVYYG